MMLMRWQEQLKLRHIYCYRKLKTLQLMLKDKELNEAVNIVYRIDIHQTRQAQF